MLRRRLIVSVVIIVAAAVAVGLFPVEIGTSSDPSVLETVFDNRLVVWAARLLLLSAGFVLASGGAFVVLSIIVRTRDGDWLKRAGPFEVSETTVRALRRQLTYWQETAADLEDQVLDLSEDS